MSQQNKAPRILPPAADIDGKMRDEAYATEMQEYRRRIETALEQEDQAHVLISLPREKKSLVRRFVEYMTTDPIDFMEIAEKNLEVVQIDETQSVVVRDTKPDGVK